MWELIICLVGVCDYWLLGVIQRFVSRSCSCVEVGNEDWVRQMIVLEAQ